MPVLMLHFSTGWIPVIFQYMSTQLFAFVFATDSLHLLDCTVTWSLLTRTDAD